LSKESEEKEVPYFSGLLMPLEEEKPKKKRKKVKKTPKVLELVCPWTCGITVTWNKTGRKPTRCPKCGSILKEK